MNFFWKRDFWVLLFVVVLILCSCATGPSVESVRMAKPLGTRYDNVFIAKVLTSDSVRIEYPTPMSDYYLNMSW